MVVSIRTESSHKASFALPHTHCIDSSRGVIHGIPSRVARGSSSAHGNHTTFTCWMRTIGMKNSERERGLDSGTARVRYLTCSENFG